MTNQHPITPPPELVQEWEADWHCSGNTNGNGFTYFVATRAAQWGSNIELEACMDFVQYEADWSTAEKLRAARRPKPPSLKEQALDELHISFDRGYLKGEAADTIRRALEQLPE